MHLLSEMKKTVLDQAERHITVLHAQGMLNFPGSLQCMKLLVEPLS